MGSPPPTSSPDKQSKPGQYVVDAEHVDVAEKGDVKMLDPDEGLTEEEKEQSVSAARNLYSHQANRRSTGNCCARSTSESFRSCLSFISCGKECKHDVNDYESLLTWL